MAGGWGKRWRISTSLSDRFDSVAEFFYFFYYYFYFIFVAPSTREPTIAEKSVERRPACARVTRVGQGGHSQDLLETHLGKKI